MSICSIAKTSSSRNAQLECAVLNYRNIDKDNFTTAIGCLETFKVLAWVCDVAKCDDIIHEMSGAGEISSSGRLNFEILTK